MSAESEKVRTLGRRALMAWTVATATAVQGGAPAWGASATGEETTRTPPYDFGCILSDSHVRRLGRGTQRNAARWKGARPNNTCSIPPFPTISSGPTARSPTATCARS